MMPIDFENQIQNSRSMSFKAQRGCLHCCEKDIHTVQIYIHFNNLLLGILERQWGTSGTVLRRAQQRER